jgi:hypothetical protein
MANYPHNASLAQQKWPISAFLQSLAKGVPCTRKAWPDRYTNQTNVCSPFSHPQSLAET